MVGDATTWDGTGNTICDTQHGSAGSIITKDCSLTGRYVYVVIPGNNKILTTCEVQVMKQATPPPPTPVPTLAPTPATKLGTQTVSFTGLDSASYNGDQKNVYEQGYAKAIGVGDGGGFTSCNAVVTSQVDPCIYALLVVAYSSPALTRCHVLAGCSSRCWRHIHSKSP